MGERVSCDQLVVGEVFFDVRRPDGGLMRVDGARVMRSVETYTVIDFTRIPSGMHGQFNMIGGRTGGDLVRVQPMEPEFLAETISKLLPNEHLTIFRLDDGIWA